MSVIKIYRKMCMVLLLALISLAFWGRQVETIYARQGESKLNGGVGNYGNNNRYYYVDSSCNNVGGLVNTIATAWSDWINTTVYTPISVVKTTNKSASSFDFYYEEFSEFTSWYGRTYYYTNPSTAVLLGDGPVSNYDWTEIKVNELNYLTLSTNSSGLNLRKYVVAHKIGHALGLRHETDPVNNTEISIMRHSPEWANTDKCSAYDLNQIKTMYTN